MSLDPDNLEHDISVEDLLLKILRELQLHTLILKEISGLDIDKGDLDE